MPLRQSPYLKENIPPPIFSEAKNRRQKVRATGLDPNHWYIAAIVSKMKKKSTKEIVFWKKSIVLYRDENGDFHALENRCAHRQLKLHNGVVDGCNLVCQYHGWKYNKEGKVISMEHDDFGLKDIRFKIKSYPVKIKYGFVWIFFGEKDSDSVALPSITELDMPNTTWVSHTFEFHWKAHHSMILENVSDYTHQYLHRKTEPFIGTKLESCEKQKDGTIHAKYNSKIATNAIMNLFIDRKSVTTGRMELVYDYPYNRGNTDNYIRHFICIIPIDENYSQFFFCFLFSPFKIPFTPFKTNKLLTKLFAKISGPVSINKVMAEDKMAVEWEMEGYQNHWDAPVAELNPMVNMFQDLTIEKWDNYVQSMEKS